MEREAAYIEAPTDMTATAAWSGPTLTIRTAVVGGAGEVRQTLSIRTDRSLLVETTTLRPGAEFRPVKAVYRRYVPSSLRTWAPIRTAASVS
jgi:hypothetical protein